MKENRFISNHGPADNATRFERHVIVVTVLLTLLVLVLPNTPPDSERPAFYHSGR